MASKKTSTAIGLPAARVSNDELLDELASFLYDAYQDHKQKASDTIELRKGQNADNESENTKL